MTDFNNRTETIQFIPIDLLDAHPDNPRLFWREDVIASIANQIIARGGFDIAYSLLVRPLNGRYQIVDGHHRLIAAERAGLSEVPCWVRGMDDDEAYMQLALAQSHDALTGLEYGKHALKLEFGQGGRGKKGGLREYARLAGKSVQYISQMRTAAEVLNHCLEVWEAKLSSHLTFSCNAVDNIPDKCPNCGKAEFSTFALTDPFHPFIENCVVDDKATICDSCELIYSTKIKGYVLMVYEMFPEEFFNYVRKDLVMLFLNALRGHFLDKAEHLACIHKVSRELWPLLAGWVIGMPKEAQDMLCKG